MREALKSMGVNSRHAERKGEMVSEAGGNANTGKRVVVTFGRFRQCAVVQT